MSYWRVWVPGGTGGGRPGGLSGSLWVREESGSLVEMDHWGQDHHPTVPINASIPAMVSNRYGPTAQVDKASLLVGEYHPRVWRPFYSPSPDRTYRAEWTTSVQAARNLFLDMRDIFRCIEPVAANDKAHGHRLRELLILACTEVESAWKSVLVANGYTSPRRHMITDDYVKLLGPLALDQWELSLVMHPGFPSFKPFAGWQSAKPTESLSWYSAYNAVKHGRETEFNRATLKALVEALGAVFVMISAQFGPWLPPYDGEAAGGNVPQFGPIILAEQLAAVRTLWADDFACEMPDWPLADTYVPPWCETNATWSAKQARF
jgi:hypothetical protein